jgi:3-hydroxyisobutyrate dehydrogenase
MSEQIGSSAKQSVAFLGLGTMGSGMARRLMAAGFPLAVYNRDAAKTDPFGAEGARVAASPKESAAGADIIVSMVADDAASRGVWLGENGALAGARAGAVLIESSTLSVDWVKELADIAKQRGFEFIDAPVTGSKPQAASGELCFLVGGKAETLEKARPALQAMSRAIIHLGPTGSGALLKLINNFLGGVQTASLAEAVSMVERGGLNREKAIDVLKNGAPGSPMLKVLSDRMTSSDYRPNFLTRLMAKDLTYAIDEARKHSLELTTAKAALEVFKNAVAQGHGEKDMSSIVEQFRRV